MGPPPLFQLLRLAQNGTVLVLVRKQSCIQVTCGWIALGKLICIDRFHSHLYVVHIFQKNMAEVIVKLINVNDVLKAHRRIKPIVFSQGEGIATDTIVIIFI